MTDGLISPKPRDVLARKRDLFFFLLFSPPFFLCAFASDVTLSALVNLEVRHREQSRTIWTFDLESQVETCQSFAQDEGISPLTASQVRVTCIICCIKDDCCKLKSCHARTIDIIMLHNYAAERWRAVACPCFSHSMAK